MATQRRHEIIEVLDCDVGARPVAAPGVDALLPHVRGASRAAGSLVVEVDPRAGSALEAFVEAERLCCAGIGWEIERDGGLRLRLRITAGEEQLSALESLWRVNK